MLEMLEREEVAGPLSDPAFADPVYRSAHYREVWRALKRLAERNDGETLYQLGQAAGLPWGVIRSPDEVLDDRHLRARGHFVELEHPELGRSVTYAGAPYLAHGSPWVTERRPPLLGEHTAEVTAQWAVPSPIASDRSRVGGSAS
jgi:crotonobetainyl-CoA:carnitine CoA-transferase CaiB-like acyl-CoA transferase